MHGQTELVAFVLLFLVGTVLFISAVSWGRSAFAQNASLVSIGSAESFFIDLDSRTQNVIKFGGQDRVDYPFNAQIELVDPQTLEISFQTNNVPSGDWFNVSSDGSLIREISDNGLFRIQLKYQFEDFDVEMFTYGSTIATPRFIFIEKASPIIRNDRNVVRIKLTFQ